jgi:hypothetical protein
MEGHFYRSSARLSFQKGFIFCGAHLWVMSPKPRFSLLPLNKGNSALFKRLPAITPLKISIISGQIVASGGQRVVSETNPKPFLIPPD